MRTTQVDICVCTWRRPFLDQTLGSIAALEVPPEVSVRVIVADNDDSPSARALVKRWAASMPMDVIYLHSPASNISIARNACLDEATGDFIAFIDDDCVIPPYWLSALLETATDTGADVVLGPVVAIYGPATPEWIREADLHSTRPVFVDGVIRQGYTCNSLSRRASPAVRGRRFNLARGRTGGEDTEFFVKLHTDGGRIVYAPQALMEEPVEPSRASFLWLARRRFRAGQTHGHLLAELHPGQRVRQIALAAGKAGWCLASAAFACAAKTRRNSQAIRAMLHVGAACALLGVREIRLYGVADGGREHAA